MFCTKCGKEINPNMKFCTKCGAPVTVAAAEKPEIQAPAAEKPELNPPAAEKPELNALSDEKPELKATAAEKPELKDPAETTVIGNGTGGNGGNTPGKDKSANKKIVIVALILAVLLLALVGEIIYLIKSNKTDNDTPGGGGGITEVIDHIINGNKSHYTVTLKEADNESTEIKNGTVSVYSTEADNSGEAVAQLTYSDDDNGVGYIAVGLDDGDYIIECGADGYLTERHTVSVADGEMTEVVLAPLPAAGTVAFKVDWGGTHDIDLCVFNAADEEYISIGSDKDSLGSHVNKDNNSSSGYEIIYLPESDADIVRTVYAVDTPAAKDDIPSTMEADGVHVVAYNSTGDILMDNEADGSMDAPIWNIGYLYEGQIYDNSDYMGDCAGLNKWAQYMKEGQLARLMDRIIELNSDENAIPTFDPSVDNYSPAAGNSSKAWDKTVFYALEEHLPSAVYYDKNLCFLKKLQVHSALTGNTIDYDIYLNPDKDIPNKIVSIEYLENGIEVYEYYFDNDGKVSFIFHYTTDNYVSTYATVDKVGERYLFDDDSMTTWRIVHGGNRIDNFCFGSSEEARLNEGSWAKSSIKEYATLDSDTQRRYDETERRMINYAYNTYNMVINTEGVGRIVGIIYSENYDPYPDAVVELYDKSFTHLLYTTSPADDGEYCIFVPNDEYEYNLKIRTNGGDYECDIYCVEINISSLIVYVDTVFIFDGSEGEQLVSLYIGNAFYGYGSSICDANIYVRRGVNNRTGEICLSTVTNIDGYVELYLLPGVYTIEASKTGYESIFYTIVANPSETNWYEYYTPPTLSNGEYAIVLSWGEYPSDLDSHLFTNGDGGNHHVWYADKYDALNSYLDVDDTTSYGPETVTIRNFNPNSYYKYCVIDYTNSSCGYYGSYEMSYSNATVNVYSAGGHVATYHVPVNRSGVVWEVFEIRNGVLTPIQRYYDNMDDYSWWDH